MFTRSRAPRRFLAVLVAATATVTMGATAHAAQPPGLPPVGDTFDLTWEATDVPLATRFGLVTVDLTGELTVDIEADPTDPIKSVRAPVSGFHGTGTLPGDQGGTITIEQSVAEDTESLIRLTETFPPTYEQVIVLDYTVTIADPAMTGRAEPLALSTKEPAQLVGKLTQFPPKGDLYQLQSPVDLVVPDDPDTTIATIEKFPVKVGGL